jgi:hypothetical protein
VEDSLKPPRFTRVGGHRFAGKAISDLALDFFTSSYIAKSIGLIMQFP